MKQDSLPVRVLSTDAQSDVDDRQALADRIYSAALATGSSRQDAEDAVEHAGLSAR